ncbi:hypothetical protein OG884_18730 [Streptosporangium sp. NBC_01755]|uniref:hypothetical protein n=1 Tax=Streptosporangium sp. NBC_01755 TaxID=2975949 RepID=UPI002DD7BE93|nr:hypothetical protein [Streptosporangium sp. NBC_01755]WSD03844.1 hypothetical protein OG884_18730 [Streptosporangium sp. NBC_01755]
MAIRLPTAARNAAADAIVDLADAGSGAAVMEIRSGSQPASANDSASGTLLATVTLADPAFGAASTGVASLSGTPLSATGAADGTAGWFRIKDSAAATVLDGSVTVTGGGGDLTLNTTTISTGVDFELTSGTITMPAG